MIRSPLHRIKELEFGKGGFKRNFLYTFSSRSFIIVLTLVVTPIFSRYYDPEAYGYFSILNILILHFGALSTLNYADAILISKERKEVMPLAVLCLALIAFSAVVLTGLFPWITGTLLNSQLEWNAWKKTIFIGIPIVWAFLGVLNRIAHFENNFAFASFQTSLANLITRISGLFFAIIGNGYYLGLVLSEGISRTIEWLFYLGKYKGDMVSLRSYCQLDTIKFVAKKYIHYPLYALPTRYFSLLISQLPIIYVVNHFELSVLGQLAMASSLMHYPLSLLGNSLAPVFLRRIRDSGEEEMKNLMGKLNVYISLAGILPLVAVSLAAPIIFSVFLGDNWALSGAAATIIILPLLHELVFMIFGSVYQLKGIQKMLFIMNSFFLVINGSAYYLLNEWGIDFDLMLIIFTGLNLIFAMIKTSVLFGRFNMIKAMLINIGSGLLLLILLYYHTL